MGEKSRSLELKVGIFVFAGLVVMTWFVLWIGDFKLVKHGYNFNVTFGFANGIKVGAPVRLAGVDRGEVKEIRMAHDEAGKTTVTIIAWVESDTEIPRGSRAWVNTLGLLGEKYLELIPGQNYAELVREGDILVGEDPTSVQEVTDLAKDVALQAKDTLSSIQAVLGELDGLLKDVRAGEGTVGKLFTDEDLYTNIEEMFADLKKNPWKLLYRPREESPDAAAEPRKASPSRR
jgi:phospholipid/cholesterol/gamma-HCH transport system substrate-binding protein